MSTQTVLDRQAASEVLDALRQIGWAEPRVVGCIVKAAGGTVTIPKRDLAGLDDITVYRHDDFAADSIVLRMP